MELGPTTYRRAVSSQPAALPWLKGEYSNKQALAAGVPPWVQSRGQFPDIVWVLKLGQSSCRSLYCPASVCVAGGGKVETSEGSWGGMCSMQAIGFASCRLVRKIVVEKALRKGTETFT